MKNTPSSTSRRQWLTGAAATAVTAVSAASVSRVAMAALPEAPQQTSADTAGPWTPPGVTGAGRPYQPVVTLNGWTLPWRMNNGVKEFHLVAEPVEREIAPGMVARLWGYNGQSPGPTIEVVEGDRVRIFVTNKLPEVTSVHWHGQRLPCGMDGVTGLTQQPIAPGKTFVYEFVARRPGTFMYHPHADEMVQMAMGMMGLWITHPKAAHPHIAKVQRDYAFLLNAFDVEPGSMTPKVNTMLDHNIWCWNSRVFPAISPLVARQGERVRIRVGNLTMTNHPIHLHGHEFTVTGTDGGPVPKSARWPEVPPGYMHGGNAYFERVLQLPARFNRMVFYDGGLFHCSDNGPAGTLPDDPWHAHFKVPAWLEQLIAQGALGQKTKGGIYRKVGKEVHVLDLGLQDFRPSSGELSAYRYENGRTLWSDALARTSITPSNSSRIDTSKVPPPRSYTAILRSPPFLSMP